MGKKLLNSLLNLLFEAVVNGFCKPYYCEAVMLMCKTSKSHLMV